MRAYVLLALLFIIPLLVDDTATFTPNQAYASKAADSALTTNCNGPQGNGGGGFGDTEVSIGLGVSITPRTTKKMDINAMMAVDFPNAVTVYNIEFMGVWRTTSAIPAFGVAPSGLRVLYSEYLTPIPNVVAGVAYFSSTMTINGQDNNVIVLNTAYNYYLTFDCGNALPGSVYTIHGNTLSGQVVGGTLTDILVVEY